MKNLLVVSTSTVYGGEYLDYITDEMAELFKDTDEVVFIPYARPGGISHDQYTAKAAEAFNKIGKKLIGLHTFDNPVEALKKAKGAFTGGGNTFVLVSALYRLEFMQPLREAIFNGLPYMAIVYPPSFKTLGVIPFNLNPHYLDPDPNSKHMGETRETRIAEFHTQNTVPVVGLREGSWLRVKGDEIILKGELEARIFEQGKVPYEVKSETILNSHFGSAQ